jgi:hypothetical protein
VVDGTLRWGYLLLFLWHCCYRNTATGVYVQAVGRGGVAALYSRRIALTTGGRLSSLVEIFAVADAQLHHLGGSVRVVVERVRLQGVGHTRCKVGRAQVIVGTRQHDNDIATLNVARTLVHLFHPHSVMQKVIAIFIRYRPQIRLVEIDFSEYAAKACRSETGE